MSEGKIFNVPTQVMGELLSAAANGFFNEDATRTVMVTEQDMGALRYFVLRGLVHHPEADVVRETIEALTVAGGGDL